MYTATVADFGGVESIIYRDPLRTERSDLKQLNGELIFSEHIMPIASF